MKGVTALNEWLIRRFVKDPDNVTDSGVRYTYGKLAGVAGIAANGVLFFLKLILGILSGSLAIVADAFNNLSDAGSSVVTLVGFKLSSSPPDARHPFGHGRMEYLSALGVAALIMVAGFELAKASIEKIQEPTPADISPLMLVLLIAAIGVKLWMMVFYKRIAKRIDSESLHASAADSRNDVICTSVVLLTAVVSPLLPFAIDGYISAAVALFVMWSGFSVMRDTVSPLLGQAPDAVLVDNIKKTVMSHEGIVGVHDLMVHNYGPGRLVLSLHAEVPCDADLMSSHDQIDRIERELQEKYHALTCIHMDPVDFDNPEVVKLREMTALLVAEMDEGMTIHDFRAVFGPSHTNLIFDLVVPFSYKEVDSIAEKVQQRIHAQDERLFAVITVEHTYI